MLEPLTTGLSQLANAQGRSRGHVAEGLALCVGAVLLSAALTGAATPQGRDRKRAVGPDADKQLAQTAVQPSRETFSLVWPPLFLSLALSGLRVWNAPAGPARTRALGLWAALQGLNAVWMTWGAKLPRLQLLGTLTTLGGALLYVNESRKVDQPAAAMLGPYVSWMGLANVLSANLLHKRPAGVTVH